MRFIVNRASHWESVYPPCEGAYATGEYITQHYTKETREVPIWAIDVPDLEALFKIAPALVIQEAKGDKPRSLIIYDDCIE